MKLNNNNLTESISTFMKDAFTSTKDNISQARKNGDIFAKDFIKPIKTNTFFDIFIEKGASLMGQMTAGGVTLLMSPMNILAKKLDDK